MSCLHRRDLRCLILNASNQRVNDGSEKDINRPNEAPAYVMPHPRKAPRSQPFGHPSNRNRAASLYFVLLHRPQGALSQAQVFYHPLPATGRKIRAVVFYAGAIEHDILKTNSMSCRY